jgi:chromate transporter
LAGVAGALVATFFTFLPSFLFILIGAPFVERSRKLAAFAAPLAAISAVVGAILHLAVTLGAAVLWPADGIDGLAAALALAGFVALWRGWLGVVPVLAFSFVLGLARSVLA